MLFGVAATAASAQPPGETMSAKIAHWHRSFRGFVENFSY